MSLKVVYTCPLGHKCEEAKDGAIHRCAWYTKLEGTNPQNGEKMDEFACAMTWLPILTIENSAQQRRTAAEIESLRNETYKTHQTILPILMNPPTVQMLPPKNL
jgi:hypothetical protein